MPYAGAQLINISRLVDGIVVEVRAYLKIKYGKVVDKSELKAKLEDPIRDYLKQFVGIELPQKE